MTKAGNSINVIHPYRTEHGYWAFDDAEVGLNGEPFVGTINDMIDAIVGTDAHKCEIWVSEHPIPDQNWHLRKCHPPDGGMEPGWYKAMNLKKHLTGWLCPALLHYFKSYPYEIFAKIKKVF